MVSQNFNSQSLKQKYHKPKLHSYGNISVLTQSKNGGGKCDNGSINFPTCGVATSDSRTQ